MADSETPKSSKTIHENPLEIPSETKKSNNSNPGYSGKKFRYPNPPDATNPDPATLRDQWRYAIRQYSRWYSHAWGTAILAGVSFFALGWIIKGENPIASFTTSDTSSSSTHGDDDARKAPR